MIVLNLNEYGIDKAVSKAIDALQGGGIIAYPTETFYGLGARFDIHDALQRLYDLKKRPKEKAMPLIVGDAELLRMVVSDKWLNKIPPEANSLMDRFWPGPLTLLFPAREGLSEYLTAGTGKVAVRIPGESFSFHLARKAGVPLTATSANISGEPPAEDAEKVLGYFNDKIDLVVDGGKTPGGLPSSIVDVSGGKLEVVREGVISKETIEKFLAQSR